MKRILGIILTICMIISILPTTSVLAYVSKHDDLVVKVDLPVEGNKPDKPSLVSVWEHVSAYRWDGEFDENGCFQHGKTYTLYVDSAIDDDERDDTEFNIEPGVFKYEIWLYYPNNGGTFEDECEILSITPTDICGKYTYTIPQRQIFKVDEYGTGIATKDMEVYPNAMIYKGPEPIGTIKKGETVKVLRAFVNGDRLRSRHLIEYNGGAAYVEGRDDKSLHSVHYLDNIVIEGKVDTDNLPWYLEVDFGDVEKQKISATLMKDFSALYGTKPELVMWDSDEYKVDNIVYSTDFVNEKFSVVTATVTLKITNASYKFSSETRVDKGGEVISVNDNQMVIKYETFSGNGDKNEEFDNQTIGMGYADGIRNGTVFINRAYAKAKVNSMGGYAKMYRYANMDSDSADPGEEVYIRDETFNSKFPELKDKWYIISKEPTGREIDFMPAAFIGEIEYLDNHMPGSPGNWKSTPYTFAGGSGTLEDPYLIETANQLNSMRFGMDMHYKLIADIDLSKWGNWVPIGGSPAYGSVMSVWEKVGLDTRAFAGSLDGNGHVISGMQIVINEPKPFMSEPYNNRIFGLFSVLATSQENYTIKNLGIVDFNIDVTYSEANRTIDISAGAICGMNNGMDIYNCYSKGGKININVICKPDQPKEPQGPLAPKPTVDVDIHVGGLMGSGGGVFGGQNNPRKTYMHIEKCYNDSDIAANIENGEAYICSAGIIAAIDTTHIHECYNSGDISLPVQEGDHEGSWHSFYAAGICANAAIPEIPGIYHTSAEGSSFIQNCYNSGTISARGSSGIFYYSASDIHIENCYNTGKIIGNQIDNNNGFSTINHIHTKGCGITPYGTEYVRKCYSNGNSVSGSAWKSSPTLGRKVLAAIPEDNQYNGPYKFVSSNVGAFTDVKEDNWFADSVKWAVDKKITSGTSATTFSPDNTCTRAQILTFMWRAVGSPKMSGENPFSDVSNTDYFYDAALWAHSKGMVSENTFGADTPCTRAATVVYLWKNADSPASSYSGNFSDVLSADDYASAVAWAVSGGITSGTSDTTFSPADTCTRGQIVTFLLRALK